MSDNNKEIKNETHVHEDKYIRARKAKKIVYFIFGILEVLFAFRLIFKILGANPESTFVSVIYSITNLFIAPFNGIFRSAVTNGIETKAVLEPPLLIAMVVYALLALGIAKIIEIARARKDTDQT